MWWFYLHDRDTRTQREETPVRPLTDKELYKLAHISLAFVMVFNLMVIAIVVYALSVLIRGY